MNTSTNNAEQGFLVITNVFANEAGVQDSLSDTRIERIARMLSQGTFGAVRQQVIELFMEVGGMDFYGAPANQKAVLKLCMEVTSASLQAVELWYDPFSGRLELSAANGSVDSLSVWAMKMSKNAAYIIAA